MATKQSLTAAIEILQNANQRSSRVRHAIRHIRQQMHETEWGPATWHDFHESTRAVWREVHLAHLPQRPADFMSPSGSQYWNNKFGVYRLADHWGQGIRSCNWYLRGFDGQEADRLAVAFCRWQDFLHDDFGKTIYRMVSPDGSAIECHSAAYVKKGYTMTEEVIRPAVFYTFDSLMEVTYAH